MLRLPAVAMTFVVECSICGQAWETETQMYSAPGLYGIEVPPHDMYDRKTGEPKSIPCAGPQVPALGLGSREKWEHDWALRFVGRTRPTLLDGSGVRLIAAR